MVNSDVVRIWKEPLLVCVDRDMRKTTKTSVRIFVVVPAGIRTEEFPNIRQRPYRMRHFTLSRIVSG